MIKIAILVPIMLIVAIPLQAQQGKIHTLRNCQGELHTVTFQNQVNILWKCVSGMTTIRKQKVLQLSDQYKLDTAFFESQIRKVKMALPPHFFSNLNYLGDWYDNRPDEPAIWFTVIFAEQDKQGNYKVYAAIKALFDSTDARVYEQRRDAKVTAISFIFDSTELNKLGEKLKTTPPITN